MHGSDLSNDAWRRSLADISLTTHKKGSLIMGATTAPRRVSRVPRVIGGVLAAGLLLGVTMAFVDKPEQTLLVWAADQAHLAPDFVAVIDFDRRSPTYGKVLNTVPLS